MTKQTRERWEARIREWRESGQSAEDRRRSRGEVVRAFTDDVVAREHAEELASALRTIAVGRKAFLFYGSDDHATAAGNILSLAASCKRHDLDPELYVTEIIHALPYGPRDRYPELAPKYWRATRARLEAQGACRGQRCSRGPSRWTSPPSSRSTRRHRGLHESRLVQGARRQGHDERA